MRKDGFASSLPLLAESKSGPLTHPEELRRLFDEIDSDKNGCLDKSELQVRATSRELALQLLIAANAGCAGDMRVLVVHRTSMNTPRGPPLEGQLQSACAGLNLKPCVGCCSRGWLRCVFCLRARWRGWACRAPSRTLRHC